MEVRKWKKIKEADTFINGGGLYVDQDSTVTITNSTISGNSANAGDGSGIYVYQDAANISNSTIKNN